MDKRSMVGMMTDMNSNKVAAEEDEDEEEEQEGKVKK